MAPASTPLYPISFNKNAEFITLLKWMKDPEAICLPTPNKGISIIDPYFIAYAGKSSIPEHTFSFKGKRKEQRVILYPADKVPRIYFSVRVFPETRRFEDNLKLYWLELIILDIWKAKATWPWPTTFLKRKLFYSWKFCFFNQIIDTHISPTRKLISLLQLWRT